MQLKNAKDIFLHPQEEWSRILEEEQNRWSLFSYGLKFLGIVFALLLIWILSSINRMPAETQIHYGMSYWIIVIALRFAMSVASLAIIPILPAGLAPNFQGKNDVLGAMKLYVFISTPIWIATLLGSYGRVAGTIGAVYLLWKCVGDALYIPEQRKLLFVIVVLFLLSIFQWLESSISMMIVPS